MFSLQPMIKILLFDESDSIDQLIKLINYLSLIVKSNIQI
ncbi:hypothetical protein yaldo0001_17050 [Yersinia aldovae ATCC 35236]|nr:hypothetical protein yaldo0001_17050 [Yersinia aldovae ATCC 35236]